MSAAKLFDTKKAGKKLGISERRVRTLCEEGRLGTQISGCWVISEAELRVFKPRPTGRPAGSKRKKRKI